jgi:Tfp pilus assembly protein PilF
MRAGLLAALVAGTAALPAAAAPAAAPARDAVVETHLLSPAVKASLRALAAGAAADDPQQRFVEVRRLIEAGRAGGDPRTLGYAEALLAAWPAEAADAPVEALVLRATILQSRHEFAAARALLDRALARQPRQPQALLTRATIAQVQGDYALARSDCERLREQAPAAAAVCLAAADAATGADEAAVAALRAVAARAAPLRGWALATLGDVRLQRGEFAAAEASYRAALADGEDLNTRSALADALLAQDKAGAAIAALREAPPTDGVLLRRWLALRAANDAAAAEALRAELASRFAAAAARNEALHAREQAWFELEDGRPRQALLSARRNWQSQREPTDLWLLARAARAAGDRAAQGEVEQWLRRSGLNDARIRRELETNR